VPGQHSARRHDRTCPGSSPCQGGDDGAISPVRPGTRDPPAHDRDLTPEHDDLRVLRGIIPRQEHQPAGHPDHEQVDQTDDHEPPASNSRSGPHAGFWPCTSDASSESADPAARQSGSPPARPAGSRSSRGRPGCRHRGPCRGCRTSRAAPLRGTRAALPPSRSVSSPPYPGPSINVRAESCSSVQFLITAWRTAESKCPTGRTTAPFGRLSALTKQQDRPAHDPFFRAERWIKEPYEPHDRLVRRLERDENRKLERFGGSRT
jgi:hypothetical protein